MLKKNAIDDNKNTEYNILSKNHTKLQKKRRF